MGLYSKESSSYQPLSFSFGFGVDLGFVACVGRQVFGFVLRAIFGETNLSSHSIFLVRSYAGEASLFALSCLRILSLVS